MIVGTLHMVQNVGRSAQFAVTFGERGKDESAMKPRYLKDEIDLLRFLAKIEVDFTSEEVKSALTRLQEKGAGSISDVHLTDEMRSGSLGLL